MKPLLLTLLMGGVVVAALIAGVKLGNRPSWKPQSKVNVEEVRTEDIPEALPMLGGGSDPETADISGLIRTWEQSSVFEVWDTCAARLAEADCVESVSALIQGIFETADWEARVKLSEHLRAVSNPEVLQVLLGALRMDFGRGSPVVGEICEAISRMAQPDTVAALGALHWGAGGQGVESHKVLRAVAGIRNPAAQRALGKLAKDASAAESLRVAAEEAFQAIEAAKR